MKFQPIFCIYCVRCNIQYIRQMSEVTPLKFNKSNRSLDGQPSLHNDSEAGKSYLLQTNRMSYIFQKLPQTLQNHLIDEIVNKDDEIDESKLNLKPTGKYKKYRIKKAGTLKVQVANWCCCLFRMGSNIQSKPCVLQENVLQVGPPGEKDSYYICFDVLTVSFKRINQKRFRIEVPDSEQHSYLFEAETQQQAEAWAEALEESIKKSYGYQFKLKQVLKQEHFEKEQYVLERDFVQRCNCGDILLFKDEHTMAKLQRWSTLSEFDHVGMVLKNRKGEVFIFQSTASTGVSIMEWKHFIKYRLYNFVEKLAWRQLNLTLTNSDVSIIEDFVYANINKQFGISIDRLMVMKSVVHPKGKQKEKEEKKSYFCSELVAALYKKLGLVDKEKSTSQYWPVTFSKDLPLLKGELGPLRTIVFEEDLLSIHWI